MGSGLCRLFQNLTSWPSPSPSPAPALPSPHPPLSCQDVPYDHPIMCQARETLYMALPKEKRLVDPALTVILSCIPEGMSAKELKKMVIPRQVTHVVDKLSEIEWAEEKGGRVGKTVVVFKNTHDVAQMILRLHSNPDDWDWCVKKEGQTYINKHNGIKVEEVCGKGRATGSVPADGGSPPVSLRAFDHRPKARPAVRRPDATAIHSPSCASHPSGYPRVTTVRDGAGLANWRTQGKSQG